MSRVWFILLSAFYHCAVYAQTSVELNTGSQRMGVDLLAFHYVDKNNRWSLYNHNKAVAYYDKRKTGFLTVNSIIYNFRQGLGITANLVGDNTRFYSSIGLQYEIAIKSVSLYLLSTYEANSNIFQEDYVFLVYKANLSSRIKLVSHNEFYLSFLKWRNDISLQRIKLGIEINKTQFGVISETYQLGEYYQSALFNLGVYIKKAF
jgi:hypothetical protein